MGRTSLFPHPYNMKLRKVDFLHDTRSQGIHITGGSGRPDPIREILNTSPDPTRIAPREFGNLLPGWAMTCEKPPEKFDVGTIKVGLVRQKSTFACIFTSECLRPPLSLSCYVHYFPIFQPQFPFSSPKPTPPTTPATLPAQRKKVLTKDGGKALRK